MTPALHADLREFRYLGATFPTLSNVKLTVDRQEFVLLVGPAGSGKTTLCFCLAGIIPKMVHGVFDGNVEVGGQDLAALPLPRVSPLLGIVMQSPENQLFNVTVKEDVAFGPENLGLPGEEVAARVSRSLEFTGAAHLAGRFSHLLSGGESQRVVLSAVLALDAGVYIFDRPAAELDPAGRRALYERIFRLNRQSGKTVILVEDRLGEVAAFATRIILLDGGRIIRDMPPREFFRDALAARYGIRVPDCVALYHELDAAGIRLDHLPLTIDEAETEIQPLLIGMTPRARGSDSPAASIREVGEPAVDVRGVAHRYALGVEALRGVDLLVGRDEFVAIVGENGAGKTTLARHLVGLLRPTRGSVRILGRDITKLAVDEIGLWVGFLFQDPDYQIFNDSCLAEVAYGLRLRRLADSEVHTRATAALTRVGLADLAAAHPYTISRGQRQRLAMACVLAMRPPIVVVDEPTTGLDYGESLTMMELLEEYRQQGGTVIIITHDIDLALHFAQRIVVMQEGQVHADLPVERIYAEIDALHDSSVVPPDLAVVVRRLGLPPHLRTVSQVAAAVRDAVGQRHGGSAGSRQAH